MTLAAHAKSLYPSQQHIVDRMVALGYRDLDRSTVSRYLSGDLAIPEDTLPYLAAALRVPASTITAEIGDEDEESDLPKASGL